MKFIPINHYVEIEPFEEIKAVDALEVFKTLPTTDFSLYKIAGIIDLAVVRNSQVESFTFKEQTFYFVLEGNIIGYVSFEN